MFKIAFILFKLWNFLGPLGFRELKSSILLKCFMEICLCPNSPSECVLSSAVSSEGRIQRRVWQPESCAIRALGFLTFLLKSPIPWISHTLRVPLGPSAAESGRYLL